MRSLLIACLLAGLSAANVAAQARAPQVITRPQQSGAALISAPNESGGYLCGGCLGHAALDAEIEPENPLAPVRVRVDGLDAFVWLPWKRSLYFVVPVEIVPGRGGMRWATVEIRQGEHRFVGSAMLAVGAPTLARYADGNVAGVWAFERGFPVLFAYGPVGLSGSVPTLLLLNAANLGVETLRRGAVRVWIGAREFTGAVSDGGFPGISNVSIVVEPGQIEAGEHRIVVWSGRWSGTMPPVRFVAAGTPVNQ